MCMWVTCPSNEIDHDYYIVISSAVSDELGHQGAFFRQVDWCALQVSRFSLHCRIRKVSSIYKQALLTMTTEPTQSHAISNVWACFRFLKISCTMEKIRIGFYCLHTNSICSLLRVSSSDMVLDFNRICKLVTLFIVISLKFLDAITWNISFKISIVPSRLIVQE